MFKCYLLRRDNVKRRIRFHSELLKSVARLAFSRINCSNCCSPGSRMHNCFIIFFVESRSIDRLSDRYWFFCQVVSFPSAGRANWPAMLWRRWPTCPNATDAEIAPSAKVVQVKWDTLHCGASHLGSGRMCALVGLEKFRDKASLGKQEAELSPEGAVQRLRQCGPALRNHRPHAGQSRGETPCWLPSNRVPSVDRKQERTRRVPALRQLHGLRALDANSLHRGRNRLWQCAIACWCRPQAKKETCALRRFGSSIWSPTPPDLETICSHCSTCIWHLQHMHGVDKPNSSVTSYAWCS